MAGIGNSLLSLPPCLRRRAFLAASNPLLASFLIRVQQAPLQNTTKRLFTCTTAQHASKPFKKPSTPRAAPPAPPPSPPSASGARPRTFEEQYAKRLLDYTKGKGTLVYEAPSHHTFFALSYLTGAMLNFYAGLQANMVFKSTVSIWFTAPTLLACIFVSGAGALVALAPSKLVKTITVVPRETISSTGVVKVEPVLEIQAKAMIPFFKQKPFEAALHDVTLDRRVVATQIGAVDVPLADAAVWSSHQSRYQPLTFGQKVTAWNRSLVNTVPAFVRDTRRMARREGMAYMDVTGRGTWKVDLQGAKVLDNGNAFAKLVQEEIPVHETIWFKIRKNVLGS